MGLSDFISGLLSEDQPSDARSATAPSADPTVAVYECRDCGTTVTPSTQQCPTCDGSDIAEYLID